LPRRNFADVGPSKVFVSDALLAVKTPLSLPPKLNVPL
jgi:hypothetical protein